MKNMNFHLPIRKKREKNKENLESNENAAAQAQETVFTFDPHANRQAK